MLVHPKGINTTTSTLLLLAPTNCISKLICSRRILVVHLPRHLIQLSLEIFQLSIHPIAYFIRPQIFLLSPLFLQFWLVLFPASRHHSNCLWFRGLLIFTPLAVVEWLRIHSLKLGHDGLILLHHLVHILRLLQELNFQHGDILVLGNSLPKNLITKA